MKSRVAALSNRVLEPIGFRILPKKQAYAQGLCYETALELMRLTAETSDQVQTDSVAGIVFSKDRAMQLHALLNSYYTQARFPAPLRILYAASSPRHEHAYRTLQEIFPQPEWRLQVDFAADLRHMVSSLETERIFFLVDDQIFIRPWDIREWTRFPAHRFVPSLRLAPHLSYCYTQQADLPLPGFLVGIVSEPSWQVWKWSEGKLDWGYPLSVDGHLFATRELECLLTKIKFTSPNTLERALQIFRPLYSKRYGICQEKSIVMNLPINRVQAEIDNRHGDHHQELLLTHWEHGQMIDVQIWTGFINHSVHQELDLTFCPRVHQTV